MELASQMYKALAVLLILCGYVCSMNYPSARNPPLLIQPNIPSDFVPDAALPETPRAQFKKAEKILDSPGVTESTTEKPAGDQSPDEAKEEKAVMGNDDWTPQKGTVGPVATPRPDDSDVAPPLPSEKQKVQFLLPITQDSTKKTFRPSMWIFSRRGITGHYAEQGWIPFDSTDSKESPASGYIPPRGSSNQNVPGNIPVFPTPLKPELVILPKDGEWIPPSVSPTNSPRSIPKNFPVIVIQNGSVPFGVQPIQTGFIAPPPLPPTEVKSSLFPPLQYPPKKIAFPVPKTIYFSNPPASKPPVTSHPVEETPSSTEETTTTSTTPKPTTLSPPPSPPPPPPPPPFFILPPRKEITPVFPPIWVPSAPREFGPQKATRPVYSLETNTGDDSFGNQYKSQVFSIPINSWFPGSSGLKSQIPPQSVLLPVRYEDKPSGKLPRDEPSKDKFAESQAVPSVSSDLWIIRGTKAPAPISTAPFPQGPLWKLYFASSNGPRYSLVSQYNMESSSQLDSSLLPYSYPVMSYPVLSQPNQAVQDIQDENKENCTTPSGQNPNLIPPLGFYVPPPVPVYLPLPLPQNSYSFLPIRPPIQDIPSVVFQPPSTVDSQPPVLTQTPNKEEDDTKKKLENSPIEEKLFPPTSKLPTAENVVISPVFPFINPSVSLPKTAFAKRNFKRPPYFFGYDQSDERGPLQHRQEEADSFGTFKVSYGFRGADGVYRKVDYAGNNGYPVVQASESLLSSPPDAGSKTDDSPAGSSGEKNAPESEE